MQGSIRTVLKEALSKGEFSWPAETSLLSAGSMLSREETDLLRLTRKGILADEALTGYSILQSFLSYFIYSNLQGLYDMMFDECGNVAMTLETVSAEVTLAELLNLITKVRFGHVLVRLDGTKHHIGIYDLIELYSKERIRTDLSCSEVGSNIIYLKGDTTLPELLFEMMSKKVRRFFIENTKSFVSDRTIIAYLFSSATVSLLRKEPEKLMKVTVRETGVIDALPVDPSMKVSEAATLLLKKRRDCLVYDERVITPWDCAIKPFLMKRLDIQSGDKDL
ncbi:MAG: hypothetical protein QXV32_04860 [Conexivisphaerales archaeon]